MTELVKNPPAHVLFYRVRGRALESEHICHGSVLVVDRSLKPKGGALVVVEVDGEFAVIPFRIDPNDGRRRCRSRHHTEV